ncbi:uncharacterized protein MELLADRAFT_87639 [Melampsora larici-populina 98AG31]|uniref:Uncharacterized protein n=1 Tax=Melampsora larici-populina (strain 98AG31 / pathotype 3-4-7) TaxID=747676 RepID=F4RP58_MELLP|nr:uncharacterized protein MELLADRAFT_87639 [Melampsora larici-populina 98AG31]EGG05907.1 hypothetical protein MELLADRAFT_87639 [Melampsora larici-populina 98AG31]
MKWLGEARKHDLWDSEVDKARRLVKPPGWESDSDQVVKVKMENILWLVKVLINKKGMDCRPHSPPGSGPPPSSRGKGMKRRVVSKPNADPNASISQLEKPPAKQSQQVEIDLMSSDGDEPKQSTSSHTLIPAKKPPLEINLISSDAEEPKEAKSSLPVQVKPNAKRQYVSTVSDLLELCPLSKPSKVCDRCKIEDLFRRKEFWCHCGAKKKNLHGGRIEGAQEHWKTATCIKKTADIRSSKVLTTFFSATPKDPAVVQRLKRGYSEIACPGLNNVTWIQSRATQSIETFLENTCTIYRGNVRHKLCKELFGENATEKSLSKADKAKFLDALDARAIWLVKRHGSRNAIYSPVCLKTFIHRKSDPNTACSKCCSLKEVQSLNSAINHKYAGADTLKFTNDTLVETDAYNAKLVEFHDLRTCGKSLESSQGGDFSNYLNHVSILAKKGLFKNREAVKGLIMGVTVRAEREDAGKSLRGIRSALNLFTKTFAGRTARSQRQIQAREGGKMEPGIHVANFTRIATNLATLGYSGPIAAASDQTVCVKTLRHHNGFLVGAQGPDVPFKNAEELRSLVEEIVKEDKLCSQIRAYTIQVPLPNVPTYVVALIASRSNEGADDIASEHEKVITLAHEAGINILSMGADGAATEFSAQEKLVQKSTQFYNYSKASLNVYIKIPLFGNPPRPIISIQDPKHARKTGANQLLSGACLMVIGNSTVTIQQLAEILKMADSPLHPKDVFDSDKQDDGRALRTFSAPTLAAALRLENNTALIIAHCKYYPEYPLCPWKHGTEPCKHIFGWMRVVSPRFSVLDARFMMPKIHAVVKSAMGGRIKIPPSEHLHAGYQYAFGDEEVAENFELLRTWPTNAEIAHELTTANKIANSLAELAGMGPLESDDEELDIDSVLEEFKIPIEDEDDTPDVSVCATKDYRVRYGAKSGEWPEELAFSEAALLAKEQNKLDLLLNQVPDEVEADAIQNAAISIASLMNPTGQQRSLGIG